MHEVKNRIEVKDFMRNATKLEKKRCDKKIKEEPKL